MNAAATAPGSSRRLILAAVGGVGAAAVLTQLVLMRELLGAFSGNELVFGLSLGSWLLLTGAGAWLARGAQRLDSPEHVFGWGQIGIALLPLAEVVAVRVLRDVVYTRGAAVGVTETVLGCLVLLAPFCLLSGAMLTLACAWLARSGDRAGVGRVYVADTLGSIAGGALFSFALVPWFDHFALLGFPALLNLTLASLLAWRGHRRGLSGTAALATIALGAVALTTNVDELTTRWQHVGEVVFRASSPYGRLVVTRDAGQLTFFENGVPVIFSDNTARVEETVHYAMSQRPGAQQVLLISGGVAGAAREVLRYGVREVTCVELDPRMIEAGHRLLPGHLADPRLRLVATDGRRFVQRTAARFDVVILDLPDPSTFQLNRFYTAEFFASVKRILAPGGVLGFGLGRYENYVSPELARLLSSAQRTARSAFAQVRMIPGGRVYFLATDGPLDLDIAARLEQRGLVTQFVNRHYLAAALAGDRLADLDRAVAQPADLNTDFNPVLYYYSLRHWLSQFALPSGLLGAALVVALAVYLVRLPAVPRVLFASGFAASALEVVLLLVFQIFYGSLYQQVGLVVTVFMAGLAMGAWQAARCAVAAPAMRALRWLACAVAAFAALLPLVLPRLSGLGDIAGQGAMLLITFLLAAVVGAQFPLAVAASPGEATRVAARLFSADLTGAALGALLVSAWLIPVAGITMVCLLTAGLNLAAAGLAWRQTPSA
jgi:spermidine synthase